MNSMNDSILQMKQKLVRRFGIKLAETFLIEKKFHQLDQFLKWAFQSEEEVTSFRQSINYAVTDSDEMDLTEL